MSKRNSTEAIVKAALPSPNRHGGCAPHANKLPSGSYSNTSRRSSIHQTPRPGVRPRLGPGAWVRVGRHRGRFPGRAFELPERNSAFVRKSSLTIVTAILHPEPKTMVGASSSFPAFGRAGASFPSRRPCDHSSLTACARTITCACLNRFSRRLRYFPHHASSSSSAITS